MTLAVTRLILSPTYLGCQYNSSFSIINLINFYHEWLVQVINELFEKQSQYTKTKSQENMTLGKNISHLDTRGSHWVTNSTMRTSYEILLMKRGKTSLCKFNKAEKKKISINQEKDSRIPKQDPYFKLFSHPKLSLSCDMECCITQLITLVNIHQESAYRSFAYHAAIFNWRMHISGVSMYPLK